MIAVIMYVYLHIRWENDKPQNDSIAQLSKSTCLSTSTIDRVIKSLKDKGLLSRAGSTKRLRWIV